MKTTARMDGNTLVVAITSDCERDTYAGMTFDLKEAWDALSVEDRRAAVELLLMDDALLRGALDRLASDSVCWSSDDRATREEWLLKIGAVHARDRRDAEAHAKASDEKRRESARRCATVADEVRAHMERVTGVEPCCRAALSALRDLEWDRPATVPPHAPDAKEPA